MEIPQVAYNYVATIYHLEEAIKLDLSTHMMVLKFLLLQDIMLALTIMDNYSSIFHCERGCNTWKDNH